MSKPPLSAEPQPTWGEHPPQYIKHAHRHAQISEEAGPEFPLHRAVSDGTETRAVAGRAGRSLGCHCTQSKRLRSLRDERRTHLAHEANPIHATPNHDSAMGNTTDSQNRPYLGIGPMSHSGHREQRLSSSTPNPTAIHSRPGRNERATRGTSNPNLGREACPQRKTTNEFPIELLYSMILILSLRNRS